MSDSVLPYRWQPTRLLCPWDSSGKNTGVCCHFLLQCMYACQVASVVSDSMRPHGQQPTRLLCPQDSPSCISSVQFSRSVVSDSLRSHESQHARPPRPSPSPGVHSNSHPLSWCCHPAISSSVIPFSSCPQSLPASESFPMSQLFA